jgi:hypothetical protein
MQPTVGWGLFQETTCLESKDQLVLVFRMGSGMRSARLRNA